MNTIIDLQKDIHENAVRKGFWEEPVNIGEKLMLVVTEVAEMCEAHRKARKCTVLPEHDLYPDNNDKFKAYFEDDIKDTFEDEMADAIIRLLDMAMRAKMRYNSLRPYKHGKAY